MTLRACDLCGSLPADGADLVLGAADLPLTFRFGDHPAMTLGRVTADLLLMSMDLGRYLVDPSVLGVAEAWIWAGGYCASGAATRLIRRCFRLELDPAAFRLGDDTGRRDRLRPIPVLCARAEECHKPWAVVRFPFVSESVVSARGENMF